MRHIKVRLTHITNRGCDNHKIAHRKNTYHFEYGNQNIAHRKVHIVPKGSEKKKSTKVSMSVIADALSITSSIISMVLAIIEYLT